MSGSAVVLVADDSRSVRSWLRRHLGAHFRVIEASNGAEAVSQARLAQPDLILLDIDMPEMDGHQALAALRADAGMVDTPVLFLTGRTGADDVVEGLGLGAADYLRKPCDPDELLARVRGALRSRQRQEALRHENRQLAATTTTDELTGLGNRRAITQRLPRLFDDARRAGRTVALIMLDVDHFKRVNDSFGHLAGDRVLVAVARRLRNAVREDQLVARWGGEEFLVVSPDTDESDAAVIAERLRRVVGWEPIQVDDVRSIEVTVSGGFAVGLGDPFQVLRDADAALYAAKRGGRNRCLGSRDPQFLESRQ